MRAGELHQKSDKYHGPLVNLVSLVNLVILINFVILVNLVNLINFVSLINFGNFSNLTNIGNLVNLGNLVNSVNFVNLTYINFSVDFNFVQNNRTFLKTIKLCLRLFNFVQSYAAMHKFCACFVLDIFLIKSSWSSGLPICVFRCTEVDLTNRGKKFTNTSVVPSNEILLCPKNPLEICPKLAKNVFCSLCLSIAFYGSIWFPMDPYNSTWLPMIP